MWNPLVPTPEVRGPWEEFPAGGRPLFEAIKTPGVGEAMILDGNALIEQALPGTVATPLDPADLEIEHSDAVAGHHTPEDQPLAIAAVWPHQEGEMADAINGIRKLVASTTLTGADWNNSEIIEGDVVAAVKEVKEQPGGTINLTGSISLTRALLAAGLVDELRLLVHPIVRGSGLRLFAEGSGQVPLRLTRSATFSTGVLDLSYQPA
ncbi:dihydrofolate reductase family protein [Kitasatospora purpeofusca]|uniref:dihydrofolate reductase family protein n=1 Tax=Kitasatospora purpeofusca TaxID=67352 RepID=UPI00324BDE5B